MKKIKLLALTLAFCLIASVIPAPVAVAADTTDTVLYPIDVDFTYSTDWTRYRKVEGGWKVQVRVYNDDDTYTEEYQEIGTNKPTFDSGYEYEIDFDNCTNSSITAYTNRYDIGLPAGRSVAFKIKAPAGKYNVFFKSYAARTVISDNIGGPVSVTVDGQLAGNYNFSTGGKETVKLANTVELTGEDEVRSVVLTNLLTNDSLSIAPEGIVLVPVGAVNAQFYGNGVTENTNFTTWGLINDAAKFASYMLSYEKHGCEYDFTNTTSTGANNQYKASYLQYRVKANSSNIALAFNVWVPKDGTYSVNLITGNSHTSSMTFDIYVNDSKAGSANTTEKTGTYELENNVNLQAGENVVKIVSAETKTADSYSYLKGIQLVPVSLSSVETVKAADVFGDVSAYMTKDDNGVNFTAFSGIDSTDYSEVGFYINEEKVKVDNGSVYKYIKVKYDGATKLAAFATAEFYKHVAAPTNGYLFFSTKNLGDSYTGKVEFQPYAISADGETEIVGQLYTVTLS